jgi:hypothetical protein
MSAHRLTLTALTTHHNAYPLPLPKLFPSPLSTPAHIHQTYLLPPSASFRLDINCKEIGTTRRPTSLTLPPVYSKPILILTYLKIFCLLSARSQPS